VSIDLKIAATPSARDALTEIDGRINELATSATRYRWLARFLEWSIPVLAFIATVLTIAGNQKALTAIVGAGATLLGALNAIVDWRGTADKALERRNAWKQFQGPFVNKLTSLYNNDNGRTDTVRQGNEITFLNESNVELAKLRAEDLAALRKG
jgi:hypothetical protein